MCSTLVLSDMPGIEQPGRQYGLSVLDLYEQAFGLPKHPRWLARVRRSESARTHAWWAGARPPGTGAGRQLSTSNSWPSCDAGLRNTALTDDGDLRE
jgi:hypothetical protein